MTSNEIQTVTDSPVVLPSADPSDKALDRILKQAQAMQAAHQLGTALAATKMVPQAYQGNPDDATAAILYGAELGLSAVQSLQNVFIVRGKPAVYSRTMVAQTIAAGHLVYEVEASPEAVTWAGKRGDTGVEFVATWTLDRAKQAGFLSNDKYKSQPIEMLRAKAQAEVCRNLAPDVLLGMAHSREELDLDEPLRVESVTVKRAERGVAGLKAALAAPAPEVVESEPVSESVSEPKVAMATNTYRNRITALLKAEGLTAPEAALEWLSEQLNRPIASTADLTAEEATGVIGFLEAEQARDAAEEVAQ